MDVKIEDIKIGDRFRKDLGDLQTLAKSIQEIGLLQPIVVNQDNELIVGQRRLEACKILGQTEVSTTIVNLDDIIKGEYHENAVRKNFTTSERVAVLEEIETRRIGHKPAKGDNLAPFQNQHKGEKSREIVARYTGISPALLQKEKKNVDAARNDPNRFGQLLEKVDSGKWAINKAYKKLQNEQRRKALVETAKENKELPENVSISCGDFVIESKKLTDNSIDLIFVDPLYFRKDLPSYERLASVASRVLKPGGSIIFNVGHGIIPEVISSFLRAGLNYHWILSVKLGGDFAREFNRQIVIKHKPLLWFRKGDKVNVVDHISDYIESRKPNKEYNEMEQSDIEATHVISRLTVENQIVLDPMMGSGTTGEAALKLKRKFIGMELDEETFGKAKARLASLTFSQDFRHYHY